jgi:hypothetical protein
MAVIVSLQGSTVGDGFLIAPLGARVFDASLSLQTDSGPASVTLRAAPDTGGLVFSQTSVPVATAPTMVTVHATATSTSRGDTTIQVLEGTTVVWSMAVTCVTDPILHFRGRFEARFATQDGFYNDNPLYTATSEDAGFGPGWTWGLEGEPDFIPPTNNIPVRIETPVGRQIRFNDPIALRSHANPVVTTVDRITGQTMTGTETFTSGDAVIGERVNLGPNTYFGGNRDSRDGEPLPEETHTAGREPLALFELHVGDRFSGASAVGPFTHMSGFPNEHTRKPDSRPVSISLLPAVDERREFNLPNLQRFSGARIDALLDDYKQLPPEDSRERRNLARRIGHLLSVIDAEKAEAIMAAHPGEFVGPDGQLRTGTLGLGWTHKQILDGKVDADLRFQPGSSSVIEYFSLFTSFAFHSRMFSFHSDELCAHHISSLRAELTAGPNSLTMPSIATRQPR